MRPRLPYDDAAWEKSEEIADGWVQELLDPEVLEPIGNFLVAHYRPDDPVIFDVLRQRSFNSLFTMEYKNSSAAIIGAVMFPEEKFHEEVGVFNTPGCPIDQRGILNPNTNKTKLQDVYGEAAGVLLQLSQSSLPRIGSLDQVDCFTWKVASRPLSRAMNDLIRLGSLPRSKLPKDAFDTASS
jgi:hypothetical protein